MARSRRRRLPFLHRNWTAGITACQKWRGDRPRAQALPPDANYEDDLDGRPSKRRRVGPLPSGMGDLALKTPADIGLWLPDYPAGRCNGLRIQVFNMFHEDTPRLRFTNSLSNVPPADTTAFSARCRITIMSEKCGMPVLLYCDAQIGTVETYQAHGLRTLARLLFDPFTIPLGKIAVLHEATGCFGLADKYKLRIAIESTGNETWPPMDLHASHHDLSSGKHRYRTVKKTDDCVLYAESTDFFVAKPRMRIPLWLRESLQHDPIRTRFVMDMDVRWSTGFLENPRLEKGVLPTIVAMHPDDPIPPPMVRLVNGLLSGSAAQRYLEKNYVANRLSANGVNGSAIRDHTPHAEFPNAVANGAHRIANGIPHVNGANGANGAVNGTHKPMTNGHCATNGHVNGAHAHLNGHSAPASPVRAKGAPANGALDSAAEDGGDDEDEDDEPAEGQLTPSRSLRARREQPDYNLRNITNKAHGKEARRRRQKHADDSGGGGVGSTAANGSKNGGYYSNYSAYDSYKHYGSHKGYGAHSPGIFGLDPPPVAGKVTYLMPPEKVTIDGFVCVMCCASNPNMSHLRAHLDAHIHYQFSCELKPGSTNHHVIHIAHQPDWSVATLQPSRVFQLGRPTTALDLEKYLDGDDSWVTSRYGPQNDEKGVAPVMRVPSRPPKPKAVVRGKTLVVPHIKQPLYDPLSKALLEAGSEIRRTVVDDDWLVHKHREVVQDYSDLSAAEKDFIQEWDRFIFPRRISSDAFLPRAMREFVEEKGLWLAADPSRSIEFGKHMTVMLARGFLSSEDLYEISTRLNTARQRERDNPQLVEAAEATAVPKQGPHRSKSGCTKCGLPVIGPRMLICENRACKRRLYHSPCIQAEAKIPVNRRQWYCNDCAHMAPAGSA